jgi:hypothetical protein
MELLLNLLWLTLALPALWMWRHESVRAQNCRYFARFRPFLLFGCVLMLLFPVVSATDDLHALRQEMEESSPTKRVVRSTAGDKSPAWLSKAGALAVLISPLLFSPSNEACGQVRVVSVLLPKPAHLHQRSSRAPPFSSLAKDVALAA